MAEIHPACAIDVAEIHPDCAINDVAEIHPDCAINDVAEIHSDCAINDLAAGDSYIDTKFPNQILFDEQCQLHHTAFTTA